MVTNFTRAITHQDYKNAEKLKKYYHRIEKKIHKKPRNSVKFPENRILKHIYMDDKFIYYPTKGTYIPYIGGGVSLFFALGLLLIPTDEPINNIDWFIIYLCSFLTVFFIIYLFTKPKKEKILNRRDGLITMTGFFWQKSITMEFSKAEFAYSTGGENGIGAFLLEAIRPNTWQTFDYFGYGGAECYESMSFITWYMDKNRPLPPGEAFDEYRKADFERRKAEGFPKPLYPSKIKTPEATKEQQAERKRIGGW